MKRSGEPRNTNCSPRSVRPSSSHLNQDEVLRTVHVELGRFSITNNFYIAFQEEDEIHFELEIEGGMVLPKRSRKASNGLTEYIIKTGAVADRIRS